MGNFDKILRIVLEDSALLERLAAAETETELFESVIAVAGTRGIELTVAELQEVVRVNRQAVLGQRLPW